MSALETRTFRAENLEDALAAVRKQLGPDAIVLRQREGIVGGIGGFFGKRCVEVDVECPEPAPNDFRAQAREMQARMMQASAMPARALTNAYTAEPDVDEVEELDDDPGALFRSLLDESSVFASTLADALEREPEPDEPAPAFEPILIEQAQLEPPVAQSEPVAHAEPVAQSEPGPEPVATAEELEPVVPAPAPAPLAGLASVELVAVSELPPLLALANAGIDARLAESIVAEAQTQLRVFDPDEPFVNQVRDVLAARIQTRRFTGRAKRRVIALVGAPGSGKTAAAAKLCQAHVAMGRRVVALSLEPVRAAMELGRLTEHLDLELVTADHPGLIDFAVAKIKRADVVIVDTPGVASRDEDGWSRLAMLLRPIEGHETHLLLPGWLYPAGVDDFIGIGSEKLGLDRLILTHLDHTPGAGPAVSGALRSGIPISATATADRLVPADPYRLAQRILP